MSVKIQSLFLGTHLDNMRDMHAKGRWRKGRRVSDESVIEMHRLRSLGWKIQPIADRFGISYVSAGYILTGKRHARLMPTPSPSPSLAVA